MIRTKNHFVLDGYGASLTVKDGLLIATPGNTPKGRENPQTFQPARGKPDSIYVTAQPGTVSIDAMRWLGRTNTQLTILDWDGSIISQTTGSMLKDPGIRRAQYQAQNTPIAEQIATDLVHEKIMRQAETLEQLSIKHQDISDIILTSVEKLQPYLEKTIEPIPIKQLNQIEAQAGGIYWRTITQNIIHPKYGFPGRTGRNATDQINATLNYTYAILESECWKATHKVGLDPFAGYLHKDKNGRASFVYDLIEPFRYIADRVVIHLYDKNQLKKKDYTMTNRGHCRIKPPLTNTLINKMNKALNKTIIYQEKEMMARITIQQKTKEIKSVITNI